MFKFNVYLNIYLPSVSLINIHMRVFCLIMCMPMINMSYCSTNTKMKKNCNDLHNKKLLMLFIINGKNRFYGVGREVILHFENNGTGNRGARYSCS